MRLSPPCARSRFDVINRSVVDHDQLLAAVQMVVHRLDESVDECSALPRDDNDRMRKSCHGES